MDLIITILPVVTKDLPISPQFTPGDSKADCAAARAQAHAGEGMEGRRPSRSRAQYGDDRETSSLEAAEG